MNFINIISIMLIVLFLAACDEPQTIKKSPFPGLSDEQYSLCIELGTEVMNNMDKYGLNSPQHESSYDKWDYQCSAKSLWEVAKNQNSSFPLTPLDWANRK